MLDQSAINDIFNAKTSERSDHIIDGQGVLEVVSNFLGSKNGDPQTFIAEFKVIEARQKGDLKLLPFQPGQPHLETNEPAPCNTPGQTVGWVQQCTRMASAKGNVLTYVCKLANVTKEQLDAQKFKQTVEAMCGAQNICKGMRIGFETYRQATKSGPNMGRKNTYVRFVTIPRGDENDPNSNHPTQVARRRAAQEGAK